MIYHISERISRDYSCFNIDHELRCTLRSNKCGYKPTTSTIYIKRKILKLIKELYRLSIPKIKRLNGCISEEKFLTKKKHEKYL